MLTISTILPFLLAATLAQLDDGPVDYTGYEILNVGVGSNHEADVLKHISEDLQLELWNEPSPLAGFSMVQVPPKLKAEVRQLLHLQRFNYTVAIEDFQRAIDKEKEENSPRHHEYKRDVTSFDYGKYRKLREINDFLQQVAEEYPDLTSVITLGTSYEGRKILGIRITAGPHGVKPVVFLECGIHAREWVTTATALFIIGQLTTRSTEPQIATLINNFEWHIFPTVNPDGYVHTHLRNRGWRKTRSQSRVQRMCYGADANRNFDSAFCTVGASKTPCLEDYCGDSAFSEKETQALRDYLSKLGSRIKVYFGIHNFGQLWMYPYGYTERPASNDKQLNDIAVKSVAALRKVSGTVYKLGPIAKAIYEASGSSVDWVYDTLGVKVAFALELRDRGLYGFMIPANQIVPIATETLEGIRTAVLNA